MNWKELIGGVVATALLLLFALWTTDFEIGSKVGYLLAVCITSVVSIAWRVALNPIFCKDNLSWRNIKAYSLGVLITSVVAVIVGL